MGARGGAREYANSRTRGYSALWAEQMRARLERTPRAHQRKKGLSFSTRAAHARFICVSQAIKICPKKTNSQTRGASSAAWAGAKSRASGQAQRAAWRAGAPGEASGRATKRGDATYSLALFPKKIQRDSVVRSRPLCPREPIVGFAQTSQDGLAYVETPHCHVCQMAVRVTILPRKHQSCNIYPRNAR